MSLRINQQKVFEQEILSDPVQRIDCFLFNKLLGIPVLHYILWRASREGGVEPFLVSDKIPHSVKQLAIHKFESQWENAQTTRTPHQDIVMPRSLAMAFIQAHKRCDRDHAEIILRRYVQTALQARKWMLTRIAEFIGSEDPRDRTIGTGLINTLNQFNVAFDECVDSDQFHIQLTYLPWERVRILGRGELSQQASYDLGTVLTLLGCFMHGVPIGFINERLGFVDYERLVFPQMRVIDKDCFNTPERMNFPAGVQSCSDYGIEVSYKPKSNREAQRPQQGVHRPVIQPGRSQENINQRHILNQTSAAPFNSPNRIARNAQEISRNINQSRIKSQDQYPAKRPAGDNPRDQRDVQARLAVYQNCEAYPFTVLRRKLSIKALLQRANQ